MLFSVVIPHYAQKEALFGCLTALQQQTLPTTQFEIIVVHNESKLPSALADMLGDFQSLRLLLEPIAGSYAARNAGIVAACGEYVVFTDSDCLPASNWLEEMATYISDKPLLDRVAGEISLLRPTTNKADWCFQYERIFAFRQERSVGNGTAVTANLLVRRELFSAIGLFDTNLRSGGDKTWNLTASNAGYSIEYHQEARVMHPCRENLSELCRKHRRTYGGWFSLFGWNKLSLPIKIILVAYPLRPPIRAFIQLWQSRPTISVFMKVSFVITALRLTRVWEHLRLSFGAEPLR